MSSFLAEPLELNALLTRVQPALLSPAWLMEWEAAGSATQRADLLQNLSEGIRKSDLSLSHQLSEWALEEVLRDEEREKHSEQADLVTLQALNTLAWIGANLNDYVHSLEYCDKAFNLATQRGLQHWQCRLLNTRALPRFWLGDEMGARTDLQEALEFAELLGDSKQLVMCYINVAWLEILSEEFEAAEHHLNLLAEHLQMTDDAQLRQDHIFYLYENRLHVKLLQGQEAERLGRSQALQDALGAAQTHLQWCLTNTHFCSDKPTFEMVIRAYQAQFYTLSGDSALAVKYGETAIEFGAHSDTWVSAYAHFCLAEAYSMQERWELAIEQYQTCLSISQGQGRLREAQRALNGMAGIYARQGDYQSAYRAAQQSLQEAHTSFKRLSEFSQQRRWLHERLKREDARDADWQERLRQADILARQDALTGVLNRRGLDEGLGALQQSGEWSAAQQAEHLAVGFIDIDHFKSFNDEFSHATGDEVLRRLAMLLQQVAPSPSLLGRYGGEEFVLVAPAGDERAAWQLFETCREVIRDHGWSGIVAHRGVTVSIGLATGVPADLPELLLKADEQLYQAKREGRNRTLPQPA